MPETRKEIAGMIDGMAAGLGARPGARLAGHLTMGSPRRSVPFIRIGATTVWHALCIPTGVDAVHIDAGTLWSMPFRIAPGMDRVRVIERYRAWLWSEIRHGRVDLASLAELHGRDLACVCAPAPCHGEVLARAAAWAAGELRRLEAAAAEEAAG